ncbi:hypothetical protein TNCV_2910621 [Trichonephila clavipes]|nr:hypothetical protein TNCV_2910621 [Trichonephila clavipes]
MGRTNPAGKNSSGRSPLLMKELPCKLQYDWSRPINAESGRGNRLGRSGIMVLRCNPIGHLCSAHFGLSLAQIY